VPRIRIDSGAERGFTLLELMIVATVIGILAAMGVPSYQSALRTARIQKAISELRTISTAVDTYRAVNGVLPATLAQVGFGGRRDPWGQPYCYLNYQLGTGDGLQWAVDNGLVDPGAFQDGDTAAAPTGGSGPGGELLVGGSGSGSGGSGGGGLAGTVSPRIRTLLGAIEPVAVDVDLGRVREVVEEIGEAPLFVGVPVATVQRRDRYMLPLNSDYDLFSLGPDASTSVALGHPLALDDVIRANDGGFFGSASAY
jgi:general secretion pathway protein G